MGYDLVDTESFPTKLEDAMVPWQPALKPLTTPHAQGEPKTPCKESKGTAIDIDMVIDYI